MCMFIVSDRQLMCRMVDEAFATFPEAFPCTMPAPPAEAAPPMTLATDTPAGASERLVQDALLMLSCSDGNLSMAALSVHAVACCPPLLPSSTVS